MDLHYQIQFHTDWHCGSGLAAGADLDALVVKDKEDLPGSYLLDENSGRIVSPKDLFILPQSGCRGNLVFRDGKSSKTQ